MGLGPPGCAEGRAAPWGILGVVPCSALTQLAGLPCHCLSLCSPVPEADLTALLVPNSSFWMWEDSQAPGGGGRAVQLCW